MASRPVPFSLMYKKNMQFVIIKRQEKEIPISKCKTTQMAPQKIIEVKKKKKKNHQWTSV